MREFQEDDFEDEELPVVSGRGEGIMEEAPGTGTGEAVDAGMKTSHSI